MSSVAIWRAQRRRSSSPAAAPAPLRARPTTLPAPRCGEPRLQTVRWRSRLLILEISGENREGRGGTRVGSFRCVHPPAARFVETSGAGATPHLRSSGRAIPPPPAPPLSLPPPQPPPPLPRVPLPLPPLPRRVALLDVPPVVARECQRQQKLQPLDLAQRLALLELPSEV